MDVCNTSLSSFYNVYYYDGRIFKIVGFKRLPALAHGQSDDVGSCNSYDEKLSSSISRSHRIVLEYALCNDWKYFCTLTLDKNKYDRFDLVKFRKDFAQWIRDKRKKYPDLDLKYLVVPEQHLNGAWHLHGLFGDISSLLVSFDALHDAGFSIPSKLLNKGYFNWSDYSKKFGYCSFGLINDCIKCAFYITKYITKAISSGDIPLGSRCIFASQGLNKAELHNQILGFDDTLESFITFRNKFCGVGMTKKSDNLDWSFSFDCSLDYSSLQPLFSYASVFLYDSEDMYYQMSMDGV